MITVDKDNVHVEGSIPVLLTEITMVCKSLREVIIEDGKSEDVAKEQLQMSLDMAFMSKEEIDREVIKAMAKMILKGLA